METYGTLRSATIVFAKTPLRGTVKTRIAATVGDDQALAIYLDLLRRTARTLEFLPHHVAFTGAADARTLAPFFPQATSFFPQRGDTLGERQKNAWLQCSALGYHKLCLVGCDCPTRSAQDIATAFAALDEKYDVVIGPAEDGGYHLVAGSVACAGLFDVDGWGTPSLLRETLACAERLGLRCRLLDSQRDIDTYDDFLWWKGYAR